MSMLSALDAVLLPVLAKVGVVAPVQVSATEAEGLILAAPVVAAFPMPLSDIALRSGLAVASLDLVGAALQAPVSLMARPAHVNAGDPLPSGCDAVIAPEAALHVGPVTVFTESVAPGTYVRFRGHDLAQGSVVAAAGTKMTAEQVLVCQTIGAGFVSVHRPVVTIEIADAAHRDWVETRIRALGCTIADISAMPSMIIRDSRSDEPRLALQPGETAWIARNDCHVEIEMPRRFDGLVSAFAALVLPIVARLLGQSLRTEPVRLRRKVSSSVGVVEIALLYVDGGAAEPLTVGDITLMALATANAVLVIPAGLEGYAAGDRVGAVLTAEPFEFTSRT